MNKYTLHAPALHAPVAEVYTSAEKSCTPYTSGRGIHQCRKKLHSIHQWQRHTLVQKKLHSMHQWQRHTPVQKKVDGSKQYPLENLILDYHSKQRVLTFACAAMHVDQIRLMGFFLLCITIPICIICLLVYFSRTSAPAVVVEW